MFDYFFEELHTKELIFSDELGITKTMVPKKILEFKGQAFLLFSTLDFSKFTNFKYYFKKFGSLYLQGLIYYIRFMLFPITGYELDKQKDLFSVAYQAYKLKKNKITYLDADYRKGKIILGEELFKENEYDVINPIITSLNNDLNNYLKDNEPINIINLEKLHNFLYKDSREYYCSELSRSLKRESIISDLQEELNFYKKLFEDEPVNFIYNKYDSIYEKFNLIKYLENLIISGYFENNELIMTYEIKNTNLQNLLYLELIYYLLAKNPIGSCAYCGKPLIINKYKLRFYENNKPIYCSDNCQEDAKNERGNYKKKLKKEKEKEIQKKLK